VQELSNLWVKKYGYVETGTAAWTLPGNIKNCKVIIHAVGPVWSDVRF
jgi:O-acetyl-ADP-ribose deacetylase (regulator of RNase III)